VALGPSVVDHCPEYHPDPELLRDIIADYNKPIAFAANIN